MAEDGPKTRTRPLRIGELARLAGVSPDTLRHYERKGVLGSPERSAGGYREYADAAVARLQLVRRAMEVGFTLDELARILKERDRGGAPCRQVRELARRKLESVETRIAELRVLRKEMRSLLAGWDLRLANTRPGHRAGLLESLARTQGPAPAPPRRVPPSRKRSSRD